MWLGNNKVINKLGLKTGMEYDIARFSYDITTQINHMTSKVKLLIYNDCSR